MRNGGRARLLLVILIVTSLFLITLDLRGVKVIDGFKQGSQTIMSPFQRAGSVVLSPVKNFFSDVTHLGRTRNQIEKLEAENANLKQKLINRKNADAQLKQLKNILDLAGTAATSNSLSTAQVKAKITRIEKPPPGKRNCDTTAS